MGPISSINNLSSTYLQSIFDSTTQKTTKANSSTSQSSGNSQLSPFAQVMSTLQQLQQSNPTEYQQVTSQIASNLQSAAQTATANGNSSQASQLNQLASDFTSASQNNQMPNVQDLAQAMGGHHHHHGHFGGDTASSSFSQQLSAFQANSSADSSLNPVSIIENTLSSAGIGGTSTE